MKKLILIISLILASNGWAEDYSELDQSINNHQQQFEKVALQIWDIAEVGYQEYQSSSLLKESLAREGFRIEENVANIPTAFIAEYGEGSPVIGILGEFDALPGLAQTASPYKEKYKDNIAGHALSLIHI